MTIHEIVVGISAQKETLGLTNQQIADLANLSKSTVDRLLREDEGCNPSAQALFDVAEAVGYNVGDAPVEKTEVERIVDMYEARIRQNELRTIRAYERYNRWLKTVAIFAACLTLFVMAMLFLDMVSPGIGWVRG